MSPILPERVAPRLPTYAYPRPVRGPIRRPAAARARAAPVAVAVIAAALGAAGCHGEDRAVRDASRALATRAAAEGGPAAPAAARPGPAGGGYVLYVDGSQSMAGYAGCRVAPTTFDETIDRLAVDLGVTTLQRFGTGGSARAILEPTAISPAVHCPAFYDRAQNPDAELYQRILDDSAGRVHVYVTDGVQSDLSATQSPSVRLLRAWIDRGRPLAILALRSHFDGRGWSEARKQWTGRWQADARPFYVLLFAPTNDQLDRTLARLSAAVRERAQLLRFGDGALRCTTEPGTLPRLAESAAPAWDMYGARTTRALVSTGAAVARLACAARDGFPVGGVRLVTDRVTYGRWTGSTFTYPADAPAGVSVTADSVVAVAGGFQTFVRARLGDDPATRFGFFAARLAPGAASVSPAVAALSTDSDAEPASADRTYRFAWVVEQLLRAQVERSLPRADVAFTVTYR
ncbi:hypothetical protein tb265_14870 [Gemmatimonadetes bacterium T265]|nr:hypothetical protein tb265_14870 [Gemmatimonadetes bacterium T265]